VSLRLCLCGDARRLAGRSFYQAGKDGCGAASIAMVMQYWRKRQAKEGTLPPMRCHSAYPVFQERSRHSRFRCGAYFQQNGFQTFAFAGKWDDLKQHLEKGVR